MSLDTSRGAWVRTEDTTYGHGKFPFGQCCKCDEAACFELMVDGKFCRVCLDHKPANTVFCPFLGQQTKIFAATERWVLAGGGAGGSKTYGGARLWLKQYYPELARYEQARREGRTFLSKGWAIFFRRTMPELLQVISEFKTYYKQIDEHANWNQQEKLCVFSNGYKVQFGGMEDDDGYLRYYGGEYSLAVLDEATQFTPKQIEEIDARVRCSDPELDRLCQLYLLTNPVGGTTKQVLKHEYVDVAPPETRVKVTKTLADGRKHREYKIYIPSNLYDNAALIKSGRYEASLMNRSTTMRRALLLNDWETDEGTWVGEDWDPALHAVVPFAIPRSWNKFKCADYGFSSRSSVLWFAVDHDGGLICYRAFSCKGLTAEEMARELKKIESRPLFWKNPETGERVQVVDKEWDDNVDASTVFGPMDAATWARTGEGGESRGEVFERMGCGFYRSDKGTAVRHNAADQIRMRLRQRIATGGKDVAGLRFFRGTTETQFTGKNGRPFATGPIATIPALPFDPADPDVWDTKADDHDMDALAYGVMSRPMATERDEEGEVLDFMALRAAKTSPEKIAW